MPLMNSTEWKGEEMTKFHLSKAQDNISSLVKFSRKFSCFVEKNCMNLLFQH